MLRRHHHVTSPSFLAFKRRLLAAAKRGDIAVLLASMAPTLNAGFEPATPEQVIAARQLREGQPWTSAGTSGYMFGRFVRSRTDMGYYFEKVNGRWLMTALAAGD